MHPDLLPRWRSVPRWITPQPPAQAPLVLATPPEDAGHTHAWTPGLPGGIRCLGCGWTLRAVLARAQVQQESALCSPPF